MLGRSMGSLCWRTGFSSPIEGWLLSSHALLVSLSLIVGNVIPFLEGKTLVFRPYSVCGPKKMDSPGSFPASAENQC